MLTNTRVRSILPTTPILLLLALSCGGCWTDITITPPDDDGYPESWTATDDTTTTTTTGSSSTTSSTSVADSTSSGETPCQGASPVGDTMVSECCAESLGTCADWCAGLELECLTTVVSVGDPVCEDPVEHDEWCNVDPFDVILASEMSVQCVCGEPAESTGTETGTTTGGCELMEPPEDPPQCVSCIDDSQCRGDEECVCSSAFGPGVCLPTEWAECAWAPCDETCLFIDGAWLCSMPGC